MLSDCFSFRRGCLFPDVPCAAVLAWFVPQRFIMLRALSKSGGTRSGTLKRWGLMKVLGAHPQGGNGFMLSGERVDSHGIGLIHDSERVWKKIQLS